jgi:hypothetical protein
MGSILTKSNSSNILIHPEHSINETVFEPTNETVLHIDESPQIGKPMERSVTESQLINKLEQDGYDKLKTLDQMLPANATNKDIGDALVNIMQTGFDEFKEKTGRTMTYSEMRAAYG